MKLETPVLAPAPQLTAAIRGTFSRDDYRAAASTVTLGSKRSAGDLASIVTTIGRTFGSDSSSLNALKSLDPSRFSPAEIARLAAVTVQNSERDDYALAFLNTITTSNRSQSTTDAINAYEALSTVADSDNYALSALRSYFG